MLRYAGRIGSAELTSRLEAMLIVSMLTSAGGIGEDHDLSTVPPPQRPIDINQIARRACLDSYEAILNEQPLPPRSFSANPTEVTAAGGGDSIAILWAAVLARPQPEQTSRLKLITPQSTAAVVAPTSVRAGG
jgi:hypothetical protein